MLDTGCEVIIPPPPQLAGAAVFTVDVEDYFMSPETIPFDTWETFPLRAEIGMERILNLLDEYQVKATFYFVGWLAERRPRIVQWAAERGHEIGTHTYTHHFVNTLSEDQFDRSLSRSLSLLRELAPGHAVEGHRAPAFSLNRGAAWQFQALKRHGITYDSSINPHGTYLYGDAGAPRRPYWLHGLVEIPPAAIHAMGRVWPVGGGGTLRILPGPYLRWARKRYRAEGYPPVIYMHPWEFDPGHPALDLPFKPRLIHWWGIRSVEDKVRRLLGESRFIRMAEYAEALRHVENSRKSASNSPNRDSSD
ncbi:MAG: DUF3473 domain-containing protein [bacterium]|nr:DUF3473 domain-containing protein [bacterium]